MVRSLCSVMLFFMFAACGREGIDAADREVGEAWGELATQMAGQRELARAFTTTICPRIAEEQESCRKLQETVGAAPQNGVAQIDLTDAVAVEQVRRDLWSLEQQMIRIEQYPGKYPRLASDPDLPGYLERWSVRKEASRAAQDRYDQAARAYNRALRTFPESVTNNMFLRLKNKVYLNKDQRARNVAAPRK